MDITPHPFDQLEPQMQDEGTVLVPRIRVVRIAIKQAGGYSAVARKVGSSPGYLHDIAHGRRRGSEDVLVRLAAAVDVDLDDLAERVPTSVVA